MRHILAHFIQKVTCLLYDPMFNIKDYDVFEKGF